MKLVVSFIILYIVIVSNVSGQCVLRGKVSDKNGETLIGAAVYPKSKMSSGITTDIDGAYSIKIPESGSEIIVISFIGYKTIEDTIKCSKGTLIKNYVLESTVKSISAVVVTAKGVKNNDAQLEIMKMKSSSTIDFISAETIKKTGDANVASAVSRITGVSTNSGGLITVRGMGDRYLKTTINGSRIPTLDPFTNNIKLDLIPASLVDNIIISKTARPDLPGDWAGAYISIETKDFPDTLSIFTETSLGYNNQTTFKDVVSSEKSSTDWLGYDNGLREYNHKEYIQFNSNPSTYQEFVALGLGDYLGSLGITTYTPWNDTYTKLGYIQLGLMGNAQFNDPVAFQNANNQFNTLAYQGKAFDLINENAVGSEKKFNNNWNTTTRKAPINYSQSFSIGNQTKLFGRTLGYIVGIRYSSSVQYDPNSIRNNYSFQNNLPDTTTSKFSKYQMLSKETNGWSGLIKLAYKISKNHSLSFLFMPNLIGTNNVRDGKYVEPASNDPVNNPPLLTFSKYQFYESRKQFIYQLKSEHYFPAKKVKLEFNASYTNGKSNAPDSKNNVLHFTEGYLPSDYAIYFTYPTDLTRYFRYLKDNVLDAQASVEIPIGNKTDLVRKIKFGAAYIYNYVQNKSYVYQFSNGNGFQYPSIETLNKINPDSLFDIVTVQNGTNPYRSVYGYYFKYASPADNFFGKSNTIAAYAMADYSIIPKLRISGGLRVEYAKIFTDCYLFDSLGLAADDFRRITTDFWGFTVDIQPGNLKRISYLPSANILIKLNNNETAPMNLRLNYSQTVARPSIRELSETTFYDFESNSYVKGNSQLKMVQINNYDLRFEKYYKSGDNVSASVFYKGLKNHIELSNWGFCLSWINNPSYTSLLGLEVEGEKNFLKNFEFKANLTLVYSQTVLKGGTIYDLVGHIFDLKGGNRPMFGQAPYVINTMLTYNAKKIGLSATISYNLQGSKLVIITDPTRPDIYELPRHLLDFKISKKIGKRFGISLKILDILNAPITRSYKFIDNKSYFANIWSDITNKNKGANDLIYSKYRYGTNLVLSVSWKL
ncbi:MAG: carboxypeptidase-like regulatory domain-containing protein [Bacteroidota bacterium]